MRISFKSAITLLLAVSVAVGVLLYPARGSCITIILKDTEDKILNPDIEPNIYCGDPGHDPHGSIVTGDLGSTAETSIITQYPVHPDNYRYRVSSAKSKLMRALMICAKKLRRVSF